VAGLRDATAGTSESVSRAPASVVRAMPHGSTPSFLVFHALRVKGFAKVEVIGELTALPAGQVAGELGRLADAGHAVFREQRALWQLTPAGKEAHAAALADDVAGAPLHELKAAYPEFLDLNGAFKVLCGDWQLRDGQPNDHCDRAYDAAVIERLRGLDAAAHPLCRQFGSALERFDPYGRRLAAVAERVSDGERNLFTGVMCGSYHDVWMELHEDLILTLGVDRAAEGSF